MLNVILILVKVILKYQLKLDKEKLKEFYLFNPILPYVKVDFLFRLVIYNYELCYIFHVISHFYHK